MPAIAASRQVGTTAAPEYEVDWTPADVVTGGVGVPGYAVRWDQSPTSDAGTTRIDDGIRWESNHYSARSGSLTPGTWYAHVAPIDTAGRVGATRHAGPFVVTAMTTVPQTGIPTPTTPTDDTDETRTFEPDWIRRIGTNRTDRLLGTGGHDFLFGRGGNDTLRGLEGNDQLDGGPGDDLLDGGAGADRISCGTGLRDGVRAGAGSDSIQCRDRGRGRDVVDCGPGRDRAVVDRFDVVRNCEVVVRR
jgi:hypothetical protein